tara:strand:+ start:2542 stop:2682 length:141 start_codon:yes stop_codon:yes gene_type:complete
MSNPSLSGGGGITLDDVAVYFGFGSGLSTDAGKGAKYLNKYIPQEN